MSDGSGLLDPGFVRELEALRRRVQVRARSGGAGEHTAKRRGGSAEFQEHRPYVPGDDLRRVDWLAYARTGEPVVKLFRAEEDVVLRLLIDGSASLGFGDPSKLEVARRIGAALGYLALAGSQRVQVMVAQPRAGADSGALGRVGSPRRGRGGLPALLRELQQIDAHGAVELATAIDQTLQRAARPGVLVVLSDFFDAGPVLAALSRARAAGHDLFLIQVLARNEIEPDFEGDFALVDAETGQTVDVTLDPSAVDAYVLRLTGLIEELRAFCKRHGASYLRTTTDEPLDGVIRRFVERAVD
ncbi:MAG: DUF58 domain-containing protein [Polyangiaceae bacterium]|nr:DUF58 domain-containing protein [Polyangiaceae bacterium]